MVIDLLLAQDRLEKLAAAQTAEAAEIHAPFTLLDYSPTIRYWADYYNTPFVPLYKTLVCESGLVPSAKGDFVDGVPTSFGMAQFHNPAKDWGFSIQDSLNPDFAIKHAAKAFSEGQQSRWSCYRLLGYDSG